jgi:hypothetical protein
MRDPAHTASDFCVHILILLHYSEDITGGITEQTVTADSALSRFGKNMLKLGKSVKSKFARSNQAGAVEVRSARLT